jgi:hypothetical protein
MGAGSPAPSLPYLYETERHFVTGSGYRRVGGLYREAVGGKAALVPEQAAPSTRPPPPLPPRRRTGCTHEPGRGTAALTPPATGRAHRTGTGKRALPRDGQGESGTFNGARKG